MPQSFSYDRDILAKGVFFMGIICLENTCAIIVTYNIGKQIIDNIETLINQVHKVYIVDNHSEDDTLEALNLLRYSYNNISIIFNKNNQGIAAAQNIGIGLAMKDGYEWILFLDHDSQPHKSMVSYMFSLYNSLSEDKKQRIAIIAPRIIDINTQKEHSFLLNSPFFFKRQYCVAPYIENIISVINSGSLIKKEIFTKLGLFEEKLFIDYVDCTFCLNIISNHLSIIAVYNAILYHELGKRKNYNLFKISISPTFHSHLRRYYIYRNRIYTWRKYHYIRCYLIFDILAACFDLFRIVVFENDKGKKLLYIFRGIRDSLHNKFGVYIE
jgi:rhamnosyltransferase